MTITNALERDPAFRLASWRVKAIYPQLRRRTRIECLPGCDLVDSLVVTLKGLSTTPRDDVSAALEEMRARGLLVELEGGALAPKHAPRPRPERAPRQRSTTPLPRPAENLPACDDERLRNAFAVHLSRRHKNHPDRANPDAWARTVNDLWAAYVPAYLARQERRSGGGAGVIQGVIPGVISAPITAPITVTDTVTPLTVPFEEREFNPLSLPGNHGEKTSPEPRAGDPTVTVRVREITPEITPRITPAPPPEAPPADPQGAALAASLRAGAGARLGSGSDARLGAALLALAPPPDVPLDELVREMGAAAGAGALPGQENREVFPLGLLLAGREGDRQWLNSWADAAAVRVRKARRLAARDRPVAQQRLGIVADNTVERPAAPTLSGRVATGDVLAMLPFGPRRAGAPGHAAPLAKASGDDAPP